ncbi:MAG: rod-binding protein [Pirellula sp.]
MEIRNIGSFAGKADSGQSVNQISSNATDLLADGKRFQARLEDSLQPNNISLSNNEGGIKNNSQAGNESEDLRKAFQDFVGQTLFSQMIASMRKTQEGAAYFDGGQAEKIFQGQLDQILSQELSDASASKISDPMFKLFQLRRQ